MSQDPLSVLFPATRGMDMRLSNATFTPNQAGRFVQWTRNMRIHQGYWRTRYPFLETALETPEGFHDRAWQGATLYHPNEGQGVHYQGVGRDRIIGAYGGRLYEIAPNSGKVSEISGSTFEPTSVRIPVHLEQAENYVVRTDGENRTLIHDGDSGTFFSTGYNKAFPEASTVPNNAGPVRYLGNRLWVSAYGRRMLAGDHLHRTDDEEAIDVIRFRDQTYDFTSQWFAPEALQGDTVAISAMKLGGREYVVMHGDNMGMTGILLNIPRSEWGNQQMKLVISNETAASGPYAFAEGDWRLLFRSRRGIEETRLVLAEDNAVGGTAINLGRQVDELLEADIEELLLFSTLINPPRWERTLVTVSPSIKKGKASHRGILSMNRNPGDSIEAGSWAWEGVWTLPERMGKFQQLLEGRIDAKQRVFGLTQKPDGNGLIESREIEGLDTLADGTKIRQNGAFRTHKLSLRSEYREGSFDEIVFLLRDVYSDCDAEIYMRDSEDPEWKLYRTITACVNECGKCDGCRNQNSLGEVMIPLGKANASSRAKWVQFHVETWGVASWDFAMETGSSGSIPEKNRSRDASVSHCIEDNFGIYEYTEK